MAKTYNDHYLETVAILKEAGIDAYSLEAGLSLPMLRASLWTSSCGTAFYTADDMDETVAELVGRRSGEPVAYITGSWEFYGFHGGGPRR